MSHKTILDLEFPSICCRCLAPDARQNWTVIDGEIGQLNPLNRPQLFIVQVPICDRCKMDQEHTYTVKQHILILVVVFTVLINIFLTFVISPIGEFLLTGILGGLLIGLILVELIIWPIIDDKQSYVPCKIFHGGRNIVFLNDKYQELFRKLNAPQKNH